MLKLATQEDIPVIIQMAKKFTASQPGKLEVDDGKIIQLVNFLLNDGPNVSIIIMAYDKDNPVGIIAARKQEMIYHKGTAAVELIWWVEPEYRKGTVGKQLLDAYEYWAKKVKCDVAQLSLLETEQAELIERLYTRRKYKRIERSYIKELN